MKSKLNLAPIARIVRVVSTGTYAADVVRHSLGPNNNFPIARAVEVPAGKTIIFHSGMTPAPADPKATLNSPEYWGDTKTQALSAFGRIKESLTSLGGLRRFHGRVLAVLRHQGTAQSTRPVDGAGGWTGSAGDDGGDRGAAGQMSHLT